MLQIDISFSISNLSSNFVNACYDNINKRNGVKVLHDHYEYFIRKAELKAYPTKVHHIEYVKNIESSSINKVNAILKEYNELKTLFSNCLHE